MLTPNHGHAAFMGVFGMLAVALVVVAVREVLPDERWSKIEKYIKPSFWGLNVGLAWMVICTLFPGGVLQLLDAINNGYWHARSPAFLSEGLMKVIEWARLPGDIIFAAIAVVPPVIAAGLTYLSMKKPKGDQKYAIKPDPNI